MLELKNIVKIYQGGTVNETCLFDGFSLTIPDRQFVCVVGSNGSGKTSLLNIICGSIPIDDGEILIGGENITRMPEHRRHRRIGRVYQDPARGTCPSMTILENMSMADNKGKPFNLMPCVNRKKAEEYRAMLSQLGLGLEDKMGVKVGNLSGGQRQAMALLMSTMTPIEFLILDEHTAALDPKTAEIIMQLTGKIVAAKQLTTIMVTHNLRYAVEYGDRLLMMHQGRAELDLSGEARRNLRVEDLLAKFNAISIECGN
ncbi:MAG: ATP-binding cassette domain-containing protein [Clostridia bacterium]|nr:ATP-binding cassette domain-containing protein [Clostridia bacterium]